MENFVREEIYYREALAIGLDRDDMVIRRRMRQKMEFIFEDIASVAEPTDTDLRAFMKKQQEKYLVDPQVSFRQVYISTYKRGKSAESDARQVHADLTAGADPDSVGDPTMLEPDIRLSPLWDIKKQFGDEFGNALLEIKPGRWSGPIRSGYGLHLIFVKEREGGRLPSNAATDAITVMAASTRSNVLSSSSPPRIVRLIETFITSWFDPEVETESSTNKVTVYVPAREYVWTGF